MEVPFLRPDITNEEVEEVRDTLLSGWITTGPRTKKLEHEIETMTGANRCVCLSSATASMEMALHVLGVGPGDEVITSAYTYTASASVVCHVGAKLVLVDTAPDSYEMDYEQVAKAITPKTKAIIPVDLAGRMCNYDKVFEVVESKRHLFNATYELQHSLGRVAVIADSSHGFGSEWHGHKSGSVADFTAFSFHAVKNFTTAEGGAITWMNFQGIDTEELYKRFQLLSLHGQSKDALDKTKQGVWEYDIVMPFYKCNMTDITAAIGLAQMKRYPMMLKRREEIVNRYNEALKNVNVQFLEHYGDDFHSNSHLYLVRLLDREAAYRNGVIEQMAEQKIGCNVHFKPLPMMTAYKNLGFDIKDFPNAYHQFMNEITLPLYTSLTDEQVDYVITHFKAIIAK